MHLIYQLRPVCVSVHTKIRFNYVRLKNHSQSFFFFYHSPCECNVIEVCFHSGYEKRFSIVSDQPSKDRLRKITNEIIVHWKEQRMRMYQQNARVLIALRTKRLDKCRPDNRNTKFGMKWN